MRKKSFWDGPKRRKDTAVNPDLVHKQPWMLDCFWFLVATMSSWSRHFPGSVVGHGRLGWFGWVILWWKRNSRTQTYKRDPKGRTQPKKGSKTDEEEQRARNKNRMGDEEPPDSDGQIRPRQAGRRGTHWLPRSRGQRYLSSIYRLLLLRPSAKKPYTMDAAKNERWVKFVFPSFLFFFAFDPINPSGTNQKVKTRCSVGNQSTTVRSAFSFLWLVPWDRKDSINSCKANQTGRNPTRRTLAWWMWCVGASSKKKFVFMSPLHGLFFHDAHTFFLCWQPCGCSLASSGWLCLLIIFASCLDRHTKTICFGVTDWLLRRKAKQRDLCQKKR